MKLDWMFQISFASDIARVRNYAQSIAINFNFNVSELTHHCFILVLCWLFYLQRFYQVSFKALFL